MCQRKVDVDMLNAIKSVLADISSIALRQSTDVSVSLVDTLYVLPPLRHRPKLVLTGINIPL